MVQTKFSEKRRKSKGSHKSDKKDKSNSNDGSTPSSTMKTKHVHGLVGPAEYINETSPTHTEAQTTYNNQATSPSNAHASQTTAAQIFSQQTTPRKIQTPQPQPQPQTPQPHQQQPHQQQPQIVQKTPQSATQWSTPQQPVNQGFGQHSNSTPNFQQVQFTATPSSGQFSTNFNISTKIERPHSSAALLQERGTPQTPTPFKQPSNAASQQKLTLLAQAMNANQTQVHNFFNQLFSVILN